MSKRNNIISPAAESQGRASLCEELKVGYQANAERNLAMAAEWFPLEEEAWQTFEASRSMMKPAKTR
jgi:hypothetical protein